MTEEQLCAKMGHVAYASFHDKGDFLLIEDDFGDSKMLTLNQLSSLLVNVDISRLKCVILAACYSVNHGTLFALAGIQHVVCTHSKISNKTQLIFNEAFYSAIFGENKCICEAYKLAVEKIKQHNDFEIWYDWANYLLLSNCNEKCTT